MTSKPTARERFEWLKINYEKSNVPDAGYEFLLSLVEAAVAVIDDETGGRQTWTFIERRMAEVEGKV